MRELPIQLRNSSGVSPDSPVNWFYQGRTDSIVVRFYSAIESAFSYPSHSIFLFSANVKGIAEVISKSDG